jgi:hypothetical protein
LVRSDMPTFCRHNRLVQNCPICSREQDVEARPLVSSSAPRSGERPSRPSSGATDRRAAGRSDRSPLAGRVTVRRAATSVDDGYRSPLVPGLRSTADAERLAHELAFATARLERLHRDPPGLYAEVADPATDPEERTWLAFLIAYLGPLEQVEDPFAAIRSVRTSWSSGQNPDLDGVATGPRTAHDPARGQDTLEAYRSWAGRAGSQAAAFIGEEAWSAERRFARIFERLSLPGLHRAARFELLVSVGQTGLYEVRAGALAFGGSDQVTLAAKRAFGIGDALLLERRAAALAKACGIPLAALDLALDNWGSGQRAMVGVAVDPDPDALSGAADALGVDTAGLEIGQ